TDKKDVTVAMVTSLSSGKAQPSNRSSEFARKSSYSSSSEMIIPTPSASVSLSLYDKKPTDGEIIADIIANATAAASSKTGTYSSLSSGKASIATRPRRSTINNPFSSARSISEPINKRQSTNSTHKPLFSTSLFGKKKKEEDPVKREMYEAGVKVKEIKSTLGRLVIPKHVSDPLPQVKLELPQHALLNR
ncbi:hypothetical protein CU098_007552, partial [Rhizopus stolonifer]